MNDFYREILVKRRSTSADLLKKTGLIILTAAAMLAGLFIHPLMLIVGVALCVVSWFLITGMDVEFEYLYVNGDIDVDRIMSKSRRKRVGSFALEDMEIIAPSASHELDSYLAKAPKVLDYTSGEGSKPTYTAVYRADGGVRLVKYEFEKDVLQDIRRLAPRKISRECL